ncbi:MAG TPA: ShlB/FhaC/HecB family hemolysin secretion/activation protein [Hyphomicrobiales bacterium]|nr:ShlB/FhaC/HecB family hemolysin secretion/activation protein [Hyphomicrobiales bacterium]
MPPRRPARSRRAAWLGVLALAMAGVAAPAQAQNAVERHLPPAPPPAPPALTIGPQGAAKASAAPLGVMLRGVRLIGAAAKATAHPPPGLSGTAPGLAPAAVGDALAPFLGRPLSLKLAQDVQAAIARLYRAAGTPFVSVTLPPQEITSGVLQVRIVRFRLGKIAIKGAGPGGGGAVARGLRTTPGAPIDARALEEDLDWLNRTPYRRVEGVFAPGEATGLSNLTLDVTPSKPWSVLAGWSNTGSRATGLDRFFVGGGAWLPALNGTTLSYQLTGSADFWQDPGNGLTLQGDGFPNYLSHAGRIVIPTWPRQDLEIVPDFVATHQALDPFTTIENTVFELPVIYRSAISNILPGAYWGDLYGGVEFKTLRRSTYFANARIAGGQAALFQFVLGWSDRISDDWGLTTIDARIKADPGGIIAGNDDATWRTFTNGRVNHLGYAYGAVDLTRITRLPARFSWVSRLSLLMADQPLPDTERLSLGGFDATRSYFFDDASVDRGLVWRNELRLPTLSPFAAFIKRADSLSPYLFADLGYGQDLATHATVSLASAGIGFDYSVGTNVSAGVAAGCALQSAGATKAGDWTVQSSVTVQF